MVTRLTSLGPLIVFGSLVACGGGGATSDAGPDAATTIDAAPDAIPEASPGDALAADGQGDAAPLGACGNAFCRGGQTCVGGACVYQNCSGSQVPGDYATVQAAVTALQGVGGTICIGAGTFSESVTITAQASKNLTLIGVSAAQTKLVSVKVTETGVANATITIEGLSLTQGAQVSFDGTAAFANCSISTTTGTALDLTAGYNTNLDVDVASSTVSVATGTGVNAYASSGALTLTVEQSDLSSATGTALNLDVGPGGSGNATVINDYVHDSKYGVVLSGVGGYNVTVYASAKVIGNTIVRNGQGLAWYGVGANFQYFNDIFASDQTAVLIGQENVPATQFGSNAYFQNTTNYSGFATAGTGDVKADPMLDTSSPPGLAAGSPSRGAGDVSHSPPADFWGHPRGASVDIGCIQMP